MAFLRKYLDLKTYALIVGIWNSVSVYIPVHFHWSAESVALLVTIGNLVIAWLGVEIKPETTSTETPS